jgi:hypothetical protein
MRQELSTVAKEVFDTARSHGSGTIEATASLAARCKQDPDLYRQLMDTSPERTLWDACRHAVERQYRKVTHSSGA